MNPPTPSKRLRYWNMPQSLNPPKLIISTLEPGEIIVDNFLSLDEYREYQLTDMNTMNGEDLVNALIRQPEFFQQMERKLNKNQMMKFLKVRPEYINKCESPTNQMINHLIDDNLCNFHLLNNKLHYKITKKFLCKLLDDDVRNLENLGEIKQSTQFNLLKQRPHSYKYICKNNEIADGTIYGALLKNYRLINYIHISYELLFKISHILHGILNNLNRDLTEKRLGVIVYFVIDHSFDQIDFIIEIAHRLYPNMVEEIRSHKIEKLVRFPYLMRQIDKNKISVNEWEFLLSKNLMIASYLPSNFDLLNNMIKKFPGIRPYISNSIQPASIEINIMGVSVKGNVTIDIKNSRTINKKVNPIEAMVLVEVLKLFNNKSL